MVILLKIIYLLLTIPSVIFSDYSCGQTPIKPKLTDKISNDIVGGVDAVPYSWPWQVIICVIGWFDECMLFCGGSIIAPRWVLTAGQCTFLGDEDPLDYGVKTGVYDESKSNETGSILHRIKSINIHPNFTTEPSPMNDIALMELYNDIIFNEHVQPICLPSSDNNVIVEPNTAWATGWGFTSKDGSGSKKLKQVDLPFVNEATCKNDYPKMYKSKSMICAGKKGSDTCQGDSGGPLVAKSNSGKWYQYGITSFGYDCGESKHPGLYTRVTAFCDFIKTTTKGNVTCIDSN